MSVKWCLKMKRSNNNNINERKKNSRSSFDHFRMLPQKMSSIIFFSSLFFIVSILIVYIMHSVHFKKKKFFWFLLADSEKYVSPSLTPFVHRPSLTLFTLYLAISLCRYASNNYSFLYHFDHSLLFFFPKNWLHNLWTQLFSVMCLREITISSR